MPIKFRLKLTQWFWTSHQCVWLLSPLGKEHDPHLNSLEFPSSKDALCHVWLKLPVAQWFWRKRFSCVWFNAILLICYHSPMKMVWPFIWKKAWILVTKVYFVPSLVEIAPVVQVKKMKMWKADYNNKFQ